MSYHSVERKRESVDQLTTEYSYQLLNTQISIMSGVPHKLKYSTEPAWASSAVRIIGSFVNVDYEQLKNAYNNHCRGLQEDQPFPQKVYIFVDPGDPGVYAFISSQYRCKKMTGVLATWHCMQCLCFQIPVDIFTSLVYLRFIS